MNPQRTLSPWRIVGWAAALVVLLLSTSAAVTLATSTAPNVSAQRPQATPRPSTYIINPRARGRQQLGIPNRQVSQPQTSGGDGVGSVSQGIESCNSRSIFNVDGVALGGFAPDTYILGIAGNLLNNAGEYSTFWLRSDSSGTVRLSLAEADALRAVSTNITLVGYSEYDGRWAAFGTCASALDEVVGGDGGLADLYFRVFDDPELTPGAAPTPTPDFSAVIESSVSIGSLECAACEAILIPEESTGPSPFGDAPTPIPTELTWVFRQDVPLGSPVNEVLAPYTGDSYRIAASAGDRLVATLESAAFDPYLELWYDGAMLVGNDDGGDGTLNSMLEYEFPTDGEYYLGVRALTLGNSGAYTLFADVTSAAPAADEAYVFQGDAALNVPIENFLPTYTRHAYHVYAAAGDSVTIWATSGVFDTYVQLWDNSGNVLAENDDDDVDEANGTNSRIDYTFGAAGDYYIDVIAYSPDQSGAYSLYVALTSGGSGGGVSSTPLPNVNPGVGCVGQESTLYIGALATSTRGNNTNVRPSASVEGNPVAQIIRPNTATVIAGPTCANNRLWWQVDYRGVVGWAAEVDDDGERLLEPGG